MIRLQRAGRLEAEFITGEIHPPIKGGTLDDLLAPSIEDPGIPAAVGALGAMNLASGYQRYETSIENKLYRASPRLSDADGPIMQFRKWAQQFYDAPGVPAPSPNAAVSLSD